MTQIPKKCVVCGQDVSSSLSNTKYCHKHYQIFHSLDNEFIGSLKGGSSNNKQKQKWKDFLLQKKQNSTYPDLGKIIDIELLIPEGYELINDEYVRTIPLLMSKEIDNLIERNIVSFFNAIGYNIKKISRTRTRTADYEYRDSGIEVTALHDYLPKNSEMDKLLKRHIETNSRICAYMYLKDDKSKIEILNEKQLDNEISILCLRQHISCYRPKLINKINDKYYQDEDHNFHIIIIDFRLAHFDLLSLKREIKSILDNLGNEFPSLGGILAATPKKIDSEMMDDPDYVFINNIHCNKQHEILKKLNNFSMATTSSWITVNQIFVKYSGSTTITSPCFDCPERDEIDTRGLPTFQRNPAHNSPLVLSGHRNV